LEISLLATSITLTPGTLSVDTGWNAHGEHVLYVHNLVMGNAEDVRRSIKQDFERRILRITRGGNGS
ncbi:MAG: Na+/H+ antiporter subunit E, partial [Caldilinea sp.]|nr:Na+/H+ antiporter subunit E [Caldilinea sp.]